MRCQGTHWCPAALCETAGW